MGLLRIQSEVFDTFDLTPQMIYLPEDYLIQAVLLKLVPNFVYLYLVILLPILPNVRMWQPKKRTGL
jgi:hypothetical protein